MKGLTYLSCSRNYNRCIRSSYSRYEGCIRQHHWKILLAGLAFLGLCCLGFKSMDFESDLLKLWIYNSSNLNEETSYVRHQSSNHIDKDSTEAVIHVTKGNILTRSLLLEHAQLMELIVRLKVVYDGRVFTLQHLCRPIQLPRMHYLDHSIRTDIENMMPCQIVSPLNCFWEGSKLMNRDYRIGTSGGDNYHATRIDWRTFDFQVFLKMFQDTWYGDFFANLLNETGIGHGYITKSCLDVTDPLCPNKLRKSTDIEGFLRNGCYQIAENLYTYPKSVLLGEHRHAVQSFLFLRSASDVFQTMGPNELDWSEDKVQHVIDMWQSKLRQTVITFNKRRPYMESILYRSASFQSKRTEKSQFYVFTNNSLLTSVKEVSDDKTMPTKYMIDSGVMVLFLVIVYLSSHNPVRSHCWLAIAGVMLLLATIVAGLGISAAIGLKFTVLSTHVLPFMMLGVAVEELLVFTSQYSLSMNDYFQEKDADNPIRQTLSKGITVILLSFLVKISIIGPLSFVSIPLMRHFCGQILIITILHTGATVFLYPCVLYLDYLRQRSSRLDLLCCLLKQNPSTSIPDQPHPPTVSHASQLCSSQIIFSTEFTTSPNDLSPNNVRQYVEINPSTNPPPPSKFVSTRPYSSKPSKEHTTPLLRHPCCWKVRYKMSKTFLHIIALMPVHITIILLTIAIVILGLYSTIHLNCGFHLESVFPIHSNENNYVKHELAEFRANNFDIVTKDFEYMHHQEAVLQLNEDIRALPDVQGGGNGKFWLSSFVSWLETLQNDLDRDIARKLIFLNGSWLTNASRNGLLAMTLLVQDQDSINLKKLTTGRLVQCRQVDHTNFYLYLNAWRSHSIDYDTMPCILYPQMVPLNMDNFIPNLERPLPSVIRLSGRNLFLTNPLQFVSCKYHHRGVQEKDELSLVKAVRTITGRYTSKGLPSIPLGHVFSLSEQYLSLQYQLMVAMGASLVCIVVLSLLTLNHWPISLITSVLLISNVLSPFYFISLYQLPLNATSGVMAIWSGGLGVRLSLLVIVSYSETSGSQSSLSTTQSSDHNHHLNVPISKHLQDRMRRAISYSPCASVAISVVLSCIFISMSNVSYIWQHFLLLPLVGIGHSLFNCYGLAPVLCFYLLPATATIYPDEDPAPTQYSRSGRSKRCCHSSTTDKVYIIDTNQLSTIPEESCSVTSSSKSHTSQDNVFTAPSSQEDRKYVSQNVKSSLVVQCPHTNAPSTQELALQTSFSYRQPINMDKVT